jgi:hypothetical protein
MGAFTILPAALTADDTQRPALPPVLVPLPVSVLSSQACGRVGAVAAARL